MFSSFKEFLLSRWLQILISCLLFIIPFFWLKPGEIDIGGDATRLYFYEPLTFLKNVSLYVIRPEGMGAEESWLSTVVLFFVLALIKIIVGSSHNLVTVFNSITLVLSFLAVYGTVKELLNFAERNKEWSREIASITAGIFYVFSPIYAFGNWNNALLEHNQIFVYPITFWFILRYIHSRRISYILMLLLFSVLFADNFTLIAPKFFAFVPIILVYLFFYNLFVVKKRLDFKVIFIFISLFIGMHAFQLLHPASTFLKSDSISTARLFAQDRREDSLAYFNSVVPYVNSVNNLAMVPPFFSNSKTFFPLLFIFPATIALGGILNFKMIQKSKKLSINFVLLMIFFIVTFLLVTGNFTPFVLALYRFVLMIPGMAMFRNFNGQWSQVFLFMYTLVFGHSLYYIFSFWRSSYRYFLSVITALILILNVWPFINGSVVNSVLSNEGKSEVKIPLVMDPKYEETLGAIKGVENDSRWLVLPIADFQYQLFAGRDGGAYLGLSSIGNLTGKKDIGSTARMKPFTEAFLTSIKDKDQHTTRALFPLLNLQYVLYNRDQYIYDNFLHWPFHEVAEYFPSTIESYDTLLSSLPVNQYHEYGNKYKLYKIDDALNLPHIFVAKEVVNYANKQFKTPDEEGKFILQNFLQKGQDIRRVFINTDDQFPKAFNDIPTISFQKVNPTRYLVNIENAKDPYVLAFSESFNTDWHAFIPEQFYTLPPIHSSYFNGEINEAKHDQIFIYRNIFDTWNAKEIPTKNHMRVNGYANGWYIVPNDVNGRESYTIVLEMTAQRLVYSGMFTSIISITICIIWFWFSIRKERSRTK